MNEGDEVEVEILSIDFNKRQIILSRKNLEKSPWSNIESIYHVGDTAEGIVTSLLDNGLLVKLDNGLSGYCSYRNVSLNRYIDCSKIYEVGNVVKFRITRIDKEKHRININIKAIEEEELKAEIAPLKDSEINKLPVKAKIIDFQPDGAIYVSISNHINGFVMPHDICWQEDVKGQDRYTKGQIIDILILRLYTQEMYADCSIKNIEDTSWREFVNQYNKGDKIHCIVKKVCVNNSIQVATNIGLYGIIRQEERFLENKNPEQGEETTAEIIDIDDQKHIIYFSLRQLELEAVDEYAEQLRHALDYNAKILSINEDEIVIDVDGHKGFISRENATRSQDVNLHDIVHEGQAKKVWYLSCIDHKLQFLLKEVTSKEYPKELFGMDINEILKDLDIKNNEFIFEVNEENKAINLFQARYEDNDFKGDGKLLIDRFDGEQIHPTLENESIEPGFYFGHLKLRDIKERREKKNPYLFKLVDIVKLEGEEVNPYRYEDQLAFLQQADPKTNMAIANLLDEVGINLYKNKDRMFYELLQNADDASAEHGVQMRVQITDNYVIISHNGYPFNADDFKSITSAAQSTKKSKKQSTGYKGIGFKSVFSSSSKVLIKSGGFFFMFDKNSDEFKDFKVFYGKRNEISDWNKYIRKYSFSYDNFNPTTSIPWQLLPIWVGKMPEDLQGTLFDDGANVDIALKLDSNTADYKEAISKIIDSPKFMLFLRHTRGIEINNRVISKDKEGNHIFIQSTSDEKENSIESFIVVDDDRIEINDEYFKKCGFNLIKKEMVLANGDREMAIWKRLVDGTEENLSGSIPNKIAASDNTIISMAVPTDDNLVIQPLTSQEENRIYAYLPLRERRFKFHFYLNADFILASDREQIQGDNLWNQFIFYNVGKEIIRWVKQVGSKDQPNYLNLLQEELFPEEGADVEDIKPLAEQFNRGYKEVLETEKFILGHDEEWHSQDEIICDGSGLSKLISANDFCEIIQSKKVLPYPGIDTNFLDNKELLPSIERIDVDRVLDGIMSKDKRTLGKERTSYRQMNSEQREQIESWLCSLLDDDTYKDKVRKVLKYLPMFTFNGILKSVSEYEKNENYVLLTDEISQVASVIKQCGMILSEENMSQSVLKDAVRRQLPKLFASTFGRIAKYTSSAAHSILQVEDKITLYKFFISKKSHELGVTEDALIDWKLFCNVDGIPSTLSSLIHIEDEEDPYQLLKEYSIDESENESLKDSGILLNDGKPVIDIILKHWCDIKSNVSTEEQAIGLYNLVETFYNKVQAETREEYKSKCKSIQDTVYVNVSFIKSSDVYLFKDTKEDSSLRQVLTKISSKPIASYAITKAFAKTPFFSDYNGLSNIAIKNDVSLNENEIKTYLNECGDADTVFAKYYIASTEDNGYAFVKLENGERQYYSPDDNIKSLIDGIGNYHLLPVNLKEYADSNRNILKGEELTKTIFDYYNSFTLKEGLDNPSSDDAYVELQQLSVIVGIDDKIESIRCKFSISTSDGSLSCKLSDIHLQGNVTVGKIKFAKSELLPKKDEKENLANRIKAILETMDFRKGFLSKLFAVENSGKDAAKDVFNQLNVADFTIESAKQLSFMLLYAKENNDNVVAKVYTLSDGDDGKHILANIDYVGEDYNFVKRVNTLSNKYGGLFDIIDSTFSYPNVVGSCSGLLLLDKPKVVGGYFRPSPSLLDLSTEEKVHSFLSYIQNSKLEGIEKESKDAIMSQLGINNHLMTLSKYALPNEKLPSYVESWIKEGQASERAKFLHLFFGVEDETSVSSMVRAFLSGNATTKDLPNEEKMSSTVLRDKTVRWIKEKKLSLNKEQYDALQDLLKPVIKDSVDFASLRLEKLTLDEYEKVGSYIVYAYSHEMPHIVSMDKDALTIYSYNQGNAVVDDYDIYYNFNSGKDLLQVLAELAGDGNQCFSPNDLVSYIKDKNQGAHVGGDNDYTSRSKNEQADYSLEAQNIILKMLHDDFNLDISKITRGYSNNVISGCKTRDGITIPLVIKSYLYHDAPLHINPEEWEQLCKPNALLAVRYERGKCGCYKFKDLLQAKDKIVLTFDSQNLNIEDRFNKFAELYKWFNGFHFDFSRLAEPEYFNKETDLLDCLFNDKQNDVGMADASNDNIEGIE